MKLTCIYCKTEQFDQGKGSEEHAVLSSLGGRKSSRSICCQKCNTELGNEIDEPLAEGLRIISTFFGIITGRGKEAATLKSYGTHNGRSFDLLPGGRVEQSRVKIDRQVDEEKGIANISVSARNVDEARKLLKQQLKSFGKGIEDFQADAPTPLIKPIYNDFAASRATAKKPVPPESLRKSIQEMHRNKFNLDPDAELALKKYSIAYINFETEILVLAREIIEWDRTVSWIIFWVVHIMLLTGLVFSSIEFYKSFSNIKAMKKESSFDISLDKVSVRTSLHGIILLAISLGFYSLFIIYVYPVNYI